LVNTQQRDEISTEFFAKKDLWVRTRWSLCTCLVFKTGFGNNLKTEQHIFTFLSRGQPHHPPECVSAAGHAGGAQMPVFFWGGSILLPWVQNQNKHIVLALFRF
jgi:hypothetical protein